MLSKSSFIRGLKCHKCLWLHFNRPELRNPDLDMSRAISGTAVGELARGYFPGGELVEFERMRLSETLARTQQLIADGATVLYEPAFCFNELYCRVDILRRVGDGWEIYEVKSAATGEREDYIQDAAYQAYILRNCGLNVGRVSIMHINSKYVRNGAIDVHELFAVTDVTDKANELQDELATKAAELKGLLLQSEPVMDIGEHCSGGCDFDQYCWKHIPFPSVFDFSGMRKKKQFQMYYDGIVRMEDVPDELLTEKYQLQKLVWVDQSILVDGAAVEKFIADLEYPLAFMDFETASVAVPLYDGTCPYQQLPFQFSLHILRQPGGELEHYEYLADGVVNPQRDFINELLAVLPVSGHVLVWNQSFEKRILRDISAAFPEYSLQTNLVLARVVDLMKPFKQRAICHYGFHGSSSIKKVLPAMVPELSYDALEIADGGAAPNEWLRMVLEPDSGERNTIRRNLLAYCKMDTLAMVRILDVMSQL